VKKINAWVSARK